MKRIAARVLRDECVLESELETVPIERLLEHHAEVWRSLHDRINQLSPNFKLQRGGVCSFHDFVARHIARDRPIRVVDIGAGDCYLDVLLAQSTHPGSRFDCIDVRRAKRLYTSPQVSFTQEDVFTVLAGIDFAQYDYVVLSGFLGLLNDDRTTAVLDAVSRCSRIFIRENPRISNLIDAWNARRPDVPREYPHLFTEQTLKATLARHRFDVRALEHEYDIYVLASSRRAF